MQLTYVDLPPKHPADSAIIWLHGLGANGHDFAGLVPELCLPDALNTHFIFPNAPVQPVTINQSMQMPSWYDIYAIDTKRSFNLEDLMSSAQAIQVMLQQLIDSGIDSQRIMVAGFSQGGAVAIEAALSFSAPLAGLMVLSSYFATADTVQRNLANKDLSIQVYHGLEDAVVPEILGQECMETLKTMGYPVAYQTYSMPHAVCPPQVTHISKLIQETLL